VAAAVLFDVEALTTRELRALSRLNDSKQHTMEVREELFPIVMRTAAKVCVVSRCARGIDARGLHKTNIAALRDALLGVARPGCICLSDGFPVGDIGFDQRAIVNGDATSAAIAAASIVAKVTRDRYMHRADELHPGWEFAAHVGYSTPEHREAIQRLGVSPLHRLSFQSMAYQQLVL
jgi:ribonuclease HII